MPIEQNKAAVVRLRETVSKGDWSVLSELFTPQYVYHSSQDIKGLEGVKQMFVAMKTAFPDYAEKIERMVAEGDLVAVFYTISGTFKGEYAGMKPTGRKFSVPGVVLARFENGKQVEAWPYFDNLAWAQQLGTPLPQS
jgi:steroid delta-isomerase-like uncharacterized protein